MRCLSVRSGLDRSTFDAHARYDLRLGVSRGLVQVLVGDQGDQEHQGKVAERVKSALSASSADRSRGTHV
jgi:hypothetical protein